MDIYRFHMYMQLVKEHQLAELDAVFRKSYFTPRNRGNASAVKPLSCLGLPSQTTQLRWCRGWEVFFILYKHASFLKPFAPRAFVILFTTLPRCLSATMAACGQGEVLREVLGDVTRWYCWWGPGPCTCSFLSKHKYAALILRPAPCPLLPGDQIAP